jgi:hypothetical protein
MAAYTLGVDPNSGLSAVYDSSGKMVARGGTADEALVVARGKGITGVDQSNPSYAPITDTGAEPSTAQAARSPAEPIPKAASGETTTLTEDEIKGNAATQAEITRQNFQGNQDAVAQRSQTAYLANVDDVAGLRPQTNVTPDIATEQRINQETGETYTGLKSEANTPQETNNASKKTEGDTKIGSSSIDKDKPCQSEASPNLLHNYASFTYNLSLHALSPSDYKSLMDDPRGTYIPTNVLIAGAGRRGDGMQRSEHFSEDFFFDKLDLTTVIGMSSRSKSANAVDINFTIIEPYGMTLLNRILQQSVIAKGNYLQIPYLLQIDFFGYNDDGIPMKIEDITKYIPIKIASMGMKVTHKGAEYNIAAYPFNHQAFAESVATNPIKLSVTASTVSDFFESMIAPDNFMGPLPDSAESKAVTDVTNTNAAVRAEQEQNNSAIRENTDQIAHLAELNAFGEDNGALRHSLALQNANLTERNLVLSKLPKTDVVVKSYTEAINAWLRQPTKDKKADHYDQIKFVIDKSIAEATFPDKDTRNLLSSAYSLLQDEETGTKTNTDKLQSVISINQGMSILDVIELAIKNSSYVYKQILNIYKPGRKEVSKKELEDLMLPLKWFKVIPQIELGEYDVKRGDFAKTITYHIKESILYNTKSEDAPQGKPKHYVKDYQYIFTGKNYDILNFDLTFDTLYFTVIPANPSIKDPTSQSPAKQPTESSSVDEVYSMDQVKAIINARLAGSASLHPKKVFTAPLPGSSANDDSVAESLKRLSKNILSSSAGDMIRVDLKILGDPDFIKQDDIFFRPGTYSLEEGLKTWNKSLITDEEELFVRLMFNTPGDYDDYGLARPGSGKYTASAFSGIYKVITVKNHFAQGKFEQTLDLVRYPNQPTEGFDQTASETTAADRPVDEFGDLDGAIARQQAMGNTPGSTTGENNLVPSSPTAKDVDVETASIAGMGNAVDPGAGNYTTSTAPLRGDDSQTERWSSDMTGTNPVDVDKTGGIGTAQRPVAEQPVAPFSDVDGKSADPSTKFNNSALRRIDEQRNENESRQEVVNQQLNTYPVGSEEFNAAKREDKLLRENAKNISFNEQTVKNEISAAANGDRNETTPITASSPTGESVISGTAAPTVSKEITTFQPAATVANPALQASKIGALEANLTKAQERLAETAADFNDQMNSNSRGAGIAKVQRDLALSEVNKQKALLAAARSS